MKGLARWRPDRWVLLAAAAYLGSSIVLTWPMPAHISSQMYGQGGDAFGAVGEMQQLINSGQFPFLPGHLHGIGAPEGRLWNYAVTIATVVEFLPRWLASLAVGVVPAWNLYVLSGYLLTGLALFLLVRKLTASVAAALIAGWAYAFYPFAEIRGGSHVDFIHAWPLVILVWRTLELRAAATRRNGIWVGAAIALCLLFTPYFWLFAAVAAGTMFVIDAVLAARERALVVHLKAWGVAAVMPVVTLVALALVNATYSGGAVPNEGIEDLILYSARPLDYLVPVPGSGLLPSSDFAGDYARGIAMGERGVYIGWSVLALAIIGLIVVVRGRSGISSSSRTAALSIAAVGFVAVAFSAVPIWQVLGFTVHLPSWYVFQVSGAWRVFARFVILVMMAACVLMAYAIAAIIRNRPWWIVVPVLVVVAGVVVKDLWWKSLTPTIALPDNPIYQVLAAQHDNKIAAEYPLVFDAYSDYNYMLGADVHHHRLLDGALSGSPQEQRDLWLEPLNDPHTAGELARLGVGWVMINTVDPPDPQIPAGTPGAGFRIVAKNAGWTLWKVVARPAFAQAYPDVGFEHPEGAAGQVFAWMTAQQGTIRIETSGCTKGCDGILRFTSGSYAIPHLVTFTRNGHVIARIEVPTTIARISIPLHVGAVTTIGVSVTPPGRSQLSVTGIPDVRPLSITVTEPQFVRAR
jgi:hypothetical protein